jgi:hypothetical protein
LPPQSGQRHRCATPTSSRACGQIERIAERRVLALELRKAGGSYREIAGQLGVDVHTAHADVGAELAALRETTSQRPSSFERWRLNVSTRCTP